MVIADLITELKEYLRIDAADIEDNVYLQNFCIASAGYIASVYRYHILDETLITKQQYPQSHPFKFYLPHGPTKEGSVTVQKPDGTEMSEPFRLINDVIVFEEPILYDSGVFTITYDVGIGNGIEHRGDVEHCVALAAWLYRTADKGLEGMDQISTGVKESVKMFNGIPKNITSYFETRQVIRL